MAVLADIKRSLLPTGQTQGLVEQKADLALWGALLGYDSSGYLETAPPLVELTLAVGTVAVDAVSINVTSNASITLYKNFPIKRGDGEVFVVSENTTLDSGVAADVPIYTNETLYDPAITGQTLNVYPMIPIGMINSGGPTANDMSYAETNNQNFGRRTVSRAVRVAESVDIQGQLNRLDPFFPIIQEVKHNIHYDTELYIWFVEHWRFKEFYQGTQYHGGQAGVSHWYRGPFNVSYTNETDSFMSFSITGPANDSGLLFFPDAT